MSLSVSKTIYSQKLISDAKEFGALSAAIQEAEGTEPKKLTLVLTLDKKPTAEIRTLTLDQFEQLLTALGDVYTAFNPAP